MVFCDVVVEHRAGFEPLWCFCQESGDEGEAPGNVL